MSRHFPIFIDVATVPPLVVGAGDSIEAKIRLLRKFSPRIDLVTDGTRSGFELSVPGIRRIAGATVADSQTLFRGRPLIIIDTGDDALNGRLAAMAKDTGVPVNVPDKPALCSFYFGSIVDRDPVTVAISTSGLAPVLGQGLRARLEDMLPPGFGRLAWYLWRLRDRLRHLPAPRRREAQHRIIDGQVAGLVMDGENKAADRLALEIISGAGHDAAGIFHLIDTRAGDPLFLSLRGVQAIRNADIVLHERQEAPAILDLARHEAVIRTLSSPSRGAVSESLIRDMKAMASDGCRVALLAKGDAAISMFSSALARVGLTSEMVPSAPQCPETPSLRAVGIQRQQDVPVRGGSRCPG